MSNCCLSNSKTKKCIRESDQKTFTFPRKFSKEECLRGPIKGFTMRASCAPYLDCQKRKKSIKKEKNILIKKTTSIKLKIKKSKTKKYKKK